MKYTILVVLLLVVAGGFIYISQPVVDRETAEEVGSENAADVLAEGVVVSVDLEEVAFDGPTRVLFEDAEGGSVVVAVPSMGLPLCAASEHIAPVHEIEPGDAISVRGTENEAGEIVPCDDAAHYLQVKGTIQNEEYGFAFTYPKGFDGYVLETDDSRAFSVDPQYAYGLMLTERTEYEALQNATDPREGPPTIQLRVYENSDDLFPGVWAMRNSRESNIELAFADSTETVISGANAVNYLADGLYPIDTYVVTHGDHVYILTGSYLEANSDIRTDFLELVGSFRFIPVPEQM